MSTYPVLDNKPIDQWKVTELKEELKRRRLPVKGLKDDLIRRLDEALRTESESAKESIDDDINDGSTAVDAAENATDGMDERGDKNETGDAPDAAEKSSDNINESDNKNEESGDIIDESGTSKIELRDSDNIQVDKDDDLVSAGKENVLEEESVGGTYSAVVDTEESQSLVQTTIVETQVTVTESVVTETELSGQDLQNNETQNKNEKLKLELKSEEDSKPSSQEEAKLESSDVNNQVFEVSQVKSDSDSVSTDTITTTITTTTVTINEKNEQLKDSVIADDVKLEVDVKPSSSSDNIVVDGDKLLAMDVDELQQEENKKVTTTGEGIGGKDDADMEKKIDYSGDVGSPEKLNLDRSSGEDSMEEDGLESKEIDVKFNSYECVKTEEVTVVTEVTEVKVEGAVDDLSAEKKIVNSENKNGHAVPDVKRKFNGGQESGVNTESTKRQRRWNSEGLKVGEPQSGTNLLSPSSTTTATPKDAAFQPTTMAKRNFSRSDSMAAAEPPKERVVPPSSKPLTNSLRIDRFLRPFTLKAVQELLGKTGSVTCFWMDHIKTHCYVTYSSVEEAVETRNAVYNLQWPPNGGRLLVAEFVDPQEVKTRVEAPPSSPATPSTAASTLPPPPPATATKKPSPAPSPRLQVQRQQLPPPPSLPPPPPLADPPPPIRERALPPPPPLPERVEPPIVTLDDLFRKTKATPRIYYLPLLDEQVAEKAKARGEIAVNE